MHLPRLALLFISGVTLCYTSNIVAQHRGQAHDKQWQVTAGAGVIARPDFPGSDSLEVLPMPAFNITHGDRWFLNADGLGAYLVKRERGSLSFSLAPDVTRRDESDSAHLRGLGGPAAPRGDDRLTCRSRRATRRRSLGLPVPPRYRQRQGRVCPSRQMDPTGTLVP